MIVFGMRSRVLGVAKFNGACSACGHSETLVSTVQRYFHIFWIPVFPVGRQAVLQCAHCQKTEFAAKSANYTLARTPLSSFAGLGLIILFLVYASFASGKLEETLKAATLEPRVGDTFVMKVKDGAQKRHVLLTVVGLREGQIETQVSLMSYSSRYAAIRALDRTEKMERARLLNPERVNLRISELSTLDLEEVVRDSI